MCKEDEVGGFLDKAYDLDDPVKTRAFYRDWAKTYDAEVGANGYASPARVAEAMASLVHDRTAPLMDLGCGTGLSGEALRKVGFTTIDGSDFSGAMLAVAKEKHIYRTLIQGNTDTPVPGSPGAYDNFTAIGVFSPGHAPAEMMDIVLEHLPRGGYFGFTLNDHALEERVYEERIRDLVARESAVVAFNSYGDHLPKAGIRSKVYVLRRL